MTEAPTLEPIVIEAIERYFDRLQGHGSAAEMIESVVTDDFETGFANGLLWRGSDGLAEFLDARSVLFDESHEVLQLIKVSRTDDQSIEAQTRLRLFLRRHEPGQRGAKNSLDRRGIPGCCDANQLRAHGEWRHKSWMALPN